MDEVNGQEYWNADLWVDSEGLRELGLAEPAKEPRLGPIKSGQVGFIAAKPGVGKSMFALAIAIRLSQGLSLGHWGGSKERNITKLIDAEMTNRDLNERYQSMVGGDEPAVYFNTSGIREKLGYSPFSLGDPEHQMWLRHTAGGAECIIVDNVTFTLDPAPGGNMYSPETINQVRPLLSWAHNTNRTLILIDHKNAEGQLAGSLQKQRMADWVMLLERDDCVGDMELAFTLTWDKYRDRDGPKSGDQESWYLDSIGEWHGRNIPKLPDLVMELVRDGATQKDIAEELDVSVRHVRRIINSRK